VKHPDTSSCASRPTRRRVRPSPRVRPGRRERVGVPARLADPRREPLRATPANWSGVRIAPDGRRLAFSLADAANFDVWTYDAARDALTSASGESCIVMPSSNSTSSPFSRHV
jgi:Tol biopolymer transport system component